MSFDCLSVGILVADHLTTPISHVPRAGELVLADDLPVAVGGCAANVSLDLARAGVRVATIGCVGGDLFGRYLIDALAAGGAHTAGIRIADGAHTSQTLIVNVAGEDRRFVHTIGANALLCADDIPLEMVRQCKVLYVGGYLLLRALAGEKLAGVFRAARQAGVKTVLDIVLPGNEDCWPALDAVLPETDVFLPNSDEGEALTGYRDPVRQAERFVEAGAASVVITCGGGGSVLVDRSQRLRAGTYPVTTSAAPARETRLTPGISRACWPAPTPRVAWPGGAPWGPVACVASGRPTPSLLAMKPSLIWRSTSWPSRRFRRGRDQIATHLSRSR